MIVKTKFIKDLKFIGNFEEASIIVKTIADSEDSPKQRHIVICTERKDHRISYLGEYTFQKTVVDSDKNLQMQMVIDRVVNWLNAFSEDVEIIEKSIRKHIGKFGN